jgi:K(+)-stimulated pyrophosphate-energized sodium pump
MNFNAYPFFFWGVPVIAIMGFIAAIISYRIAISVEGNSPSVQAITDYTKQAIEVFVKRQMKFVAMIVLTLTLATWVMHLFRDKSMLTSFFIMTGYFWTSLIGFLSMSTSKNTCSNIIHSSQGSAEISSRVCISSGSFLSFSTISAVIMDLWIWFVIINILITNGVIEIPHEYLRFKEISNLMIAYCVGVSIQSLFACVGGGIFNQAAKLATVNISKLNPKIPEKDIRNPGSIASLLGRYVNHSIGLNTYVYEIYAVSIIVSMVIGAEIIAKQQLPMEEGMLIVVTPLMIAAIGLLGSLVGVLTVQKSKKTFTETHLKGIKAALITVTIISSFFFFLDLFSWDVLETIIVALLGSMVLGYISKRSGRCSTENAKAHPLLCAFIKGGESTIASFGVIIVVVLIIFFCHGGGYQRGAYVISLSAIALLMNLGYNLAYASIVPVCGNAATISEILLLPKDNQKKSYLLFDWAKQFMTFISSLLTASGFIVSVLLVLIFLITLPELIMKHSNNTELLSKIEALGKIGLRQEVNMIINYLKIEVISPLFWLGIFSGVIACVTFSTFLVKSVKTSAYVMISEAQKQIDKNNLIVKGESLPDYAVCINCIMKTIQHKALFICFTCVAFPIVVGTCLGLAGLLGLFMGLLSTMTVLSLFANYFGHLSKKILPNEILGGIFKDLLSSSLQVSTRLTILSSFVFFRIIFIIKSCFEGMTL